MTFLIAISTSFILKPILTITVSKAKTCSNSLYVTESSLPDCFSYTVNKGFSVSPRADKPSDSLCLAMTLYFRVISEAVRSKYPVSSLFLTSSS